MAESFPASILNFLIHQHVMNGINESELQALVPYFEIQSFEQGATIFNEGDTSSDLYLIYEGEVVLIKSDQSHQSQRILGHLSTGEVFGEMSFIDDSPRSCSILANKHLIVIKLRHKDISAFSPYVQAIYEKIVRNIATITIRRIRETNELFIRAKELEIRKLSVQNDLTKLLLNQLMGVVVASGLSGAFYLNKTAISYFNLVNWVSVLAVLAFIALFMYRHKPSFKTLNLNLNRYLSYPNSLFLAAFSVLLGFILYVLNSQSVDSSYSQLNLVFYFLLFPLYAFLTEVILRTGVQNMISRLIFSTSKWMAAIYTALLVAACNAYFGFGSLFLVLLVHIGCGLTYFYARNILASTLFHIFSVILLKYLGLLPFSNFT